MFFAAVSSVHISSRKPFLSLLSQGTEGITSTQKLHIGPFKFSSVAFCLPTHACMHAEDPCEWLEVGHPPVQSGCLQLPLQWQIKKKKNKTSVVLFFKLEQNWNICIGVVPTSVTRGIHLEQHFREVSGTHEREILPHRQPVIFRDGFTTELKHQCTTAIKTKQQKKKGSSQILPTISCHCFQIPFPWIPNSRKRMAI